MTKQLRGGTTIWTSPVGDTTVTTPGSALLFPTLCNPTAAIPGWQQRLQAITAIHDPPPL